jgi:hypothetical protein
MGSDLSFGYNILQLGLHVPVHPCHLSVTVTKGGEVPVPGAQKQLHCSGILIAPGQFILSILVISNPITAFEITQINRR